MTTEQSRRLAEIAELLDEAADAVENGSLEHHDDFQVSCRRCDGEPGDDPIHAPDCIVTRLRTAADDLTQHDVSASVSGEGDGK